MVVVTRDVGSEGVYVVPVNAEATPAAIASGAPASATPAASPTAGQTAVPSSSASSPVTTAAPVVTPTASAAVATESAAVASRTPAATPSASDMPVATAEPPSDAPSPDAVPTADVSSAEPSSGTQSAAPSSAPGSDEFSSVPSIDATPAPDAAIKIATGVIVVGTPIYAPDGMQLAFSARPSDGSAGPDIYVWTAGDAEARAITFDHDTWLAAWTASGILVSRVTNGIPSTYLIDPIMGAATPVGAPGTWLPSVSPGGSTAAWWSGSVKLAADGISWVPDSGQSGRGLVAQRCRCHAPGPCHGPARRLAGALG